MVSAFNFKYGIFMADNNDNFKTLAHPVQACGFCSWIYLAWETEVVKLIFLSLPTNHFYFISVLAAQLLIVQRDKWCFVLANFKPLWLLYTKKGCLLLKHQCCYRELKKNN